MAGIFYGNTLTDLQSGMTAADRNAGDTERSRVAADATKMSAYFNLLGNKAKTEAESHAREAENARLYFATNLQDAQKKAELAQGADLAAKQWAAQAQLAQGAQASNERMNTAQLAGALDVAKVRGDPTQVTVEKLREEADKKATDIQNQQQAKMAGALASQANQELESVKAEYASKSKDANANLSKNWLSGTFTDALMEKGIAGNAKGIEEANKAYNTRIDGILSKINKGGVAIKFNKNANRFEPVFPMPVASTPSVRMVPPVMPGGFNPGEEGNAGFVMPPSSNPQWIRTANGQLIRSP